MQRIDAHRRRGMQSDCNEHVGSDMLCPKRRAWQSGGFGPRVGLALVPSALPS